MLLLLLLNCAVNMTDHAKVSMKDFELLKVLGTGGECFIIVHVFTFYCHTHCYGMLVVLFMNFQYCTLSLLR